MKAIIARILTAVVVILQYRLAVVKENDKIFFSQHKNTRSATFQRNRDNNFIYQIASDRQSALLNGYDYLAITEQDPEYSLDKWSTNIGNKNTHKKLKNTKSVPTTRRSSQNMQQILFQNEAFSNTFDRSVQNKFNKSNKKRKRVAKTTVYDPLMTKPAIARKVTFGSSLTSSEAKFRNNLSSEITFGHKSSVFYYKIKPRKMKENFSDSNGINFQTKTTFLLPKILNVLHKALVFHPFKMWKLKHKFSSMRDIRVHESTLQEAIRNPWNERLKHKLYKVLQGEDVYLDAFGGSNSAGAGLKKDEGNFEGRFSQVIRHWWDKTITPITGSNLKFREIAMGGTSSEFLQFCFASYIHEKLDLVFIEMAVNDMRDLPCSANKSLPLEQLTRQLLTYSTEPALVYINLFSGSHCKTCTGNLEDYGQDFLTRTYNITSLKWRDAVCFRNAENNHLKSPCDLIASDGNHINQLGHAHISLMLINLFRKILLDHIFSAVTNSDVSSQKKPTVENQFSPEIPRKQIALPRPVLIKKTTNIISKPLCWTNLFPNYHRLTDIKNNLDVIIAKTKDFFLETSKIGEKCTKPPCRMDSVSSWTGKTVGANITFSFTIPGRNSSLSAMAIQTRSVAIGIRTCWDCGAANMWLDNDYKSKKFFNTRLHYGQTRARILAFHVKPGNHSLGAEVTREGKVFIVAIMVGPPDGPY